MFRMTALHCDDRGYSVWEQNLVLHIPVKCCHFVAVRFSTQYFSESATIIHLADQCVNKRNRPAQTNIRLCVLKTNGVLFVRYER